MTENKIWKDMEVPMELESVIINAVGEGHKRLMRKQQKKRWRAIGLSMATAAACFTAVVIGFVNPVVAKAYSSIPVIGSIFAYLYDTPDTQIPYAQIGESAVPVEEDGEHGETGHGGGNQASQANQPAQPDSEQQESLAAGDGTEAAAAETAATQDPVQIAMKEYFCDGYSLYLSFEVTSEEPLMEGVADIAGKRGGIFLYATEHITTDTEERFRIGAGSLSMKGIFTDEHTFVGIARSEGSLGEYSLTKGMVYEMESAHMRIFITDEANTDIRGDWKVSAEITCTKESLLTESLGKTIGGDCVLKEVAVQPYEIRVVIEEPKGMTLSDDYFIVAFDDKGRQLESASQTCNIHVEEGEKSLDMWMFQRPEDAEKLTVFAVDEWKWMDEWKGYLYCDEPWSGEQMVQFLKENCFAYGEVELPQDN